MAQTPLANRTFAAAHFALELDDRVPVGLFRSIEGGGLKADVTSIQGGGAHPRFRQLGKPKFDDLKLQVGMAMSQPFYDWVSKFFTGNVDRRTGAIIAADFYYNERARRTFTNALISEVTIPKLDATDKNAAYMTVGLSVEDIAFAVGTGAKIHQPDGMPQQKLWTACNFRFTLSGFEDACRRVSKIDSFTVKQTVIEHHVGGVRTPFKLPSRIEFPNISFYVPEADAAKFYAQATANGRNGNWGQLNGQIEFLDNSLQKTLASVAFLHADIVSVTPDRADASTEEIKQVKVELYAELMGFSYGEIGLGDLQ
jgi:phage tail-like protein